MPRDFLPARTAAEWRPLLAHPEPHARAGRAAHALAHAWQRATTDSPGGVPPEVRALFGSVPALASADVLVVLPDHVPARDATGPISPAGALVLARAVDGLAVIAVEGTAGEPFGATLGELRTDTAAGNDVRLAHLHATLDLDTIPDDIRTRLLQRAAAAVLEADAFAARHAVVLVHAFDRTLSEAGGAVSAGFADYAALVHLFGADARPDRLTTVERANGRLLHFGWAQGTPAQADPPSPDETLRDQLGAILGGPVERHASVLLTYGDPVEVLVRADAHAVHVEVPAIEWRGHAPVLTGERRASFPREAVTRFGGEAPFIEAVLAARAERVARFRTCSVCGERNPPEWMRSATLCSRCAADRREVAY